MNGPTVHVTDDRLEALAHEHHAEIDLGGRYPTARIDGVRYVASLVDVPLIGRAV